MKPTQNQAQTKCFIKILQHLTGLAAFDSEKLLPMVEQMELMGQLIQSFNATENEEELIQIGERIKRCEAESQKMAREFFSEYRINFEEVREKFFHSPDFVGEKEAQILIDLQQKMQRIEHKLPEKPTHILPKKRGKNKQKGRERV